LRRLGSAISYGIRVAGAAGLALVAFALALGCSSEPEGASTQPALDALTEPQRQQLDAFVDHVRASYQDGNHQAIRDLIDSSRMPASLERFNSQGSIPMGPREVTAIHIESMYAKEGPLLHWEERDFVYNVEPLGRLVIEMSDVSVGPVSVNVVFGTRDGEFRLAGLEPLGPTTTGAP
jgi:hypothetical protein